MIFITGCARSGTSLTAGILKSCGARMGELNELNENTAIRDSVLKPYLERNGADPLGQSRFPETINTFPELKEAIKAYIGLSPVAAYKDAKLVLIWEACHEQFPNAKWVIVRRNTERIIDSCLRTRFMRAYDTREGWGEWVTYHLARMSSLVSVADCIEVWPEKLVSGDDSEMRSMVSFCGLDWMDTDILQPERFSL